MTTEEKVEFEHRLTETEHRAKSNTRRVEKLELQTEAIQSLATSVEVMVKEQGHQTEAIERIEKNVEKLDGKVEILEHKPAKRWESIVEKVILTVVGAVVGYLLVKVGL
jgi:nitrate/nitrite-specific signal transduction histidine kinase